MQKYDNQDYANFIIDLYNMQFDSQDFIALFDEIFERELSHYIVFKDWYDWTTTGWESKSHATSC